MQLLLRNVKILAPSSPYHRRRLDVFIRNGKIQKISKNLPVDRSTRKIESKNLHVSAGWIDIGTQMGEPGFEIRETLKTLANAAHAGGYTSIASLPNTKPVIQNRSEVEYIRQRGKALGLDIYPIGALSADTGGKDLTQMMEMDAAGAVAFTDGRKSIQNSGLLLRALQYVKSFGGTIMDLPNDHLLAPEGQINEGLMSTMLGMNGIPNMAETLMVERDISLLKYSESKMHIRCISTGQACSMIRDAQKTGLNLSCDTSAFHLFLSEREVENFDTNMKVLPPLRTKKDISSLIRALKDGTITHITSLHEPLEMERKKLEFSYADFGSIGLESCFAMANTVLKGKIALEQIVEKFTSGPRTILGLEEPLIDEGASANITFFDPDLDWTFDESHIHSLSKNAAGLGRAFIGRPLGVVLRNKMSILDI